MSAADLVRLLTDVLFVIVFVAVAVNAWRHRVRVSIDATLLFGALAAVVVQGEVVRLFGVQNPPLLAAALVVLVVALPYLLMRLLDDVSHVPAWVMRLAFAGFALSAAAVIALPAPLPLAVTGAVVLYFGAFELYGAYAFVREARRTQGIARKRMWAAASGSLFLGLAVLAVLFQSILPATDVLTRLLTFASATAYVVGFAPPGLLRRAWQEPELRTFIEHATEISPLATHEAMLGQLEDAASRAMGIDGVTILVWDPSAGGVLRSRSGSTVRPGEAVSGRAFEQQRAVLSTDPGRDDPQSLERNGAGAILAAPVTARGHRLGVLVARPRRAPAFVEDDLARLQLLAAQSAVVLDGARLYAELAAANSKLEEATRAKTEFLATMSHELRTPLNAVLGFSDLLVEQLDEEITPAQRRFFHNIREAGTHLLELINEVLDLSKVEAGKIQLRPEPIRLESLVEPVVAATRTSAEARQIAFSADLDGGGLVRVDPGRVRQVLYNLLSNAVKFTPQEGRVTLRARMAERDLHIEVADTGIGIPADKRDRVFGTFERLHEGRSDASGTGLGLALTKRLVELHGGSVSFESEEGRGTTFSVTFPHVLADVVAGERILVVEDQRADAELIAALASAIGLSVEVAGTAAAARDAIRRDPPLGVVLDLRLPDERGERILEELKAHAPTARIPVIVVSVEDDEGRARTLGADDHLTKPIERRRLAAWLATVAARSKRETVPTP